jgi:hypothetical protein
MTAKRVAVSVKPTVAFGPASFAGYGTAAVAFLLAIIAFTNGDRSEATLGTIASSVVGLLAFTVTQVGRFVQAHAAIRTLSTTQKADAAASLAGMQAALESIDAALALIAKDPAVK